MQLHGVYQQAGETISESFWKVLCPQTLSSRSNWQTLGRPQPPSQCDLQHKIRQEGVQIDDTEHRVPPSWFTLAAIMSDSTSVIHRISESDGPVRCPHADSHACPECPQSHQRGTRQNIEEQISTSQINLQPERPRWAPLLFRKSQEISLVPAH